jgi:molecular chaperone DnaJ
LTDYYKILGVEENADEETIKKAYRTQAKKYHPDKNKEPGAEETFKKVSEAYDTLGNQAKKEKYDLSRNFSGFAYNDFSQRANHSYHDPFANHYNAYTQAAQKPQTKGTSLNITLQFNLNDVLNGVEKKIKLKRNKKCNTCDGTGAEGASSFQTCANCKGSGFFSINTNRGFVQINSVQSCNVCHGTGKLVLESCLDCFGAGLKASEEVVDVNIPPGASEGMQFVIDGKGNDSRDGGKSGDLYIKVKEIPDPVFIRKGIDIIAAKQISFIDAVLGTNIDVDMPSGETIKTVVDPGTVPGTVLRFAQKGIHNMGYGGRGDFLVEVNIRIPDNVTDEQKKFLEELKENDIFK